MKNQKGKNNSFYGKKHSTKSKKKMSIWHLGKKMSEKTKQKIRESSLGKNTKEGSRVNIKCQQCGKKFECYKARKRKYCSIVCKSKGRVGTVAWNKGKIGKRIKKVCPICNKKFEVTPSEKNIINCSKKCYGLARKKQFVETGFLNSAEIRKKISKAKRGEKSHFWKGGVAKTNDRIRHLPECRIWRLTVYERDNFLCQMPNCDKTERILNAHHIIQFSDIIQKNSIKTTEAALECKELWDLNNGITLCKKCHNKIRQKEKQYIDLFQTIINSNKQ